MLPNLTTEQRLEYLELATKSRQERAQVKQNIRTGNVRLSLILQAVAKAKSDPLCGALPMPVGHGSSLLVHPVFSCGQV